MDAAAPSKLRAFLHRESRSGLPSAKSRNYEVAFQSLRSHFNSFNDLTSCPVPSHFRRLRVVLLCFLQHVVVRRWFVLVVIRRLVVFAHRKILEALPHQNTAQIRMAVENDPVKIVRFALLKFWSPIHGSQGAKMGWVAAVFCARA